MLFRIQFVKFDFPEGYDEMCDEAGEIFSDCLGETFEADDEEDLKRIFAEMHGHKVLYFEFSDELDSWDRESDDDVEED